MLQAAIRPQMAAPNVIPMADINARAAYHLMVVTPCCRRPTSRLGFGQDAGI